MSMILSNLGLKLFIAILSTKIILKEAHMSQVIMLLLFPIGLYFYLFVEKKEKPKYQKIFDDFQEKIAKNSKLSHQEKLERFQEMLRYNGYTLKEAKEHKVVGEKRILSMSILAMSVGFFYVGAFIYLVYFYYFQKPHRVEYHL